MSTLPPEKLFALFHMFVMQAQAGKQETKKYQQKLAGFDTHAGFGIGRLSRVPWFGFFTKGQTAQCGIYPVCLYYKEHDLFIVAYGISETTPPPISWGAQASDKITVFSELENRGISSSYKNPSKTGVMYGDSFVRACFEGASSIENINDSIFEDIYLNMSEILDEYQRALSSVNTEKAVPNVIIRHQVKEPAPTLPPVVINIAELEQMKNVFLDSFSGVKSFPSNTEYISSERQYKDELRSIFTTELLPLLKDDNMESAQRIPPTFDKVLRAKLPTTGTNQNIIHWLSWSYLQEIDSDTAQAVGILFRSLLDETTDLEARLDLFEEKYTTLLDEKAPSRTGKRSWQGILRPISSFILAFTFPDKYLFVRTEVLKRASERLLGYNICADYTARKATLGQEYLRIMAMSEAVLDALVDWSPQDFIDIQSFFWVGAMEAYSEQASPEPPTAIDADNPSLSPEPPAVQAPLAVPLSLPYVEPDFPAIEGIIQKSGLVLDNRTLRRYHLSLKNRKFVILAGVSGTGKTWLAEEYAKAVGAKYLNIPVAPNWTSNEDLLGFHNPVSNSFQPTDFTLFLEQAWAAQQQADAQKIASRPFHLILDEMNLARVEHYFARFLAAMELRQRHAAPCLFLGPGKELFLPANLHFIGTVNVDETTHGFADKVFDRAQLIELPLHKYLIAAHLEGKDYAVPLMAFWDALRDVAPFAFRVLDDIAAYVQSADALGTPWNEALDEMLVQKVLPRIKGNDPHLAEVFDILDAIAVEHNFSLVSEKIAYMRASYHEHGFTSFFR